MTKTIGIIGAGVAGLAATKTALQYGLTPVCFEQRDDIGIPSLAVPKFRLTGKSI